MGRVIVERLRGRPAPEFRYRDIGDLAMIGRFRVVARLPFLALTGLAAWLIWIGIHLLYLNGLQTRLLVSIRWAWSLFTNGRGSRLITGAHSTYGALPPLGRLDDGSDLPGVGERYAA